MNKNQRSRRASPETIRALQQVNDTDDAVFVHQHVELCTEIPVEVRVDGVAYQHPDHQHRLHEPPWCVEYVQCWQQNNTRDSLET